MLELHKQLLLGLFNPCFDLFWGMEGSATELHMVRLRFHELVGLDAGICKELWECGSAGPPPRPDQSPAEQDPVGETAEENPAESG